jgi:phosphoribosyl-ATP pyrophosphohydrolase
MMKETASKNVLDALAEVIAERANAGVEQSYTASLLTRGTRHCARKMGEEAVETVIAAISEDDEALKSEAADLLYHLLVVLRARGIPLEDVMQVLAGRFGVSGLEEKAARNRQSSPGKAP